jgi:hypothetical protein
LASYLISLANIKACVAGKYLNKFGYFKNKNSSTGSTGTDAIMDTVSGADSGTDAGADFGTCIDSHTDSETDLTESEIVSI